VDSPSRTASASSVGKGWGLALKPAPKPVTPAADAKPLDSEALKAQLAALGGGRIKLGNRR
jgi:hypothetical protein